MSKSKVIQALSQTQKQVNDISRIPLYTCGATITHSVTRTLTGAAQILPFDTVIRTSGIAWNGTTWTVGASGMYALHLSFVTGAAVGCFIQITLDGLPTSPVATFTSAQAGTTQAFNLIRYFTTGQTVSIILNFGTGTTMFKTNEGLTGESPILTICQLTPKIV